MRPMGEDEDDKGGADAKMGWQPWYLLGVLLALYIVSSVDRTVLNLLVGPIKSQLKISDTQMSLLLGTAFAAFYGVMSIPAGHLVDKINRKYLIMASVTFWSCCTAFGAFAQNFAHLFWARAGVGFGEATLTPSAFSLIRDSFPAARRGRAFSVYMLGAAFGGGASLSIVGWLLSITQKGGPKAGLIAGFAPWQLVLLTVGVGGMAVLGLLAFVKEPPRRSSDAAAGGAKADKAVTFSEAFAHMRSKAAVYLPNLGGYFLGGLYGFGSTAWMPTAIARNTGLKAHEIGLTMGMITLIISPIAVLGWGVLNDVFTKRKMDNLMPIVCGAAMILSAWMMAAVPQVGVLPVMWLLIGLGTSLHGGSSTMHAVVLARVTPGRLMGKVASINYFVATVIGSGLGPTVMALISDNLFTGPRAMGNALTFALVFLGTLNGLSVLLITWGLKRVERRTPPAESLAVAGVVATEGGRV